MNLSEINYPVFKLRDSEPLKHGTLKYYLFENYVDNEDGEIVSNNQIRLVDDLAIEHESLGMRRLILKNEGYDLLKLNRAIYFLGDLIKIADTKTWFIDNSGKVFNYRKDTRTKLSFHKVTKLLRIPTGGVIVEAHGVPQRMKALFAPIIPRDQLHVGVLHLGMSKILYGFYSEKHTDTWRKV
jgi:hypothetical protein